MQRFLLGEIVTPQTPSTKLPTYISNYVLTSPLSVFPRSPAPARTAAGVARRRWRAACAWTRPSTRCSCRADTSCAAENVLLGVYTTHFLMVMDI